MKVNEALVAIMEDVGAVDKGGNNKVQGWKFRGIEQVINGVSPALRRHGVVIVPVASEVEYVERTNQKGNSVIDSRVRVTYRWFGPEGDFIDSVVVAEARDLSDKATAKAMSVAFRTSLVQTLALPTEDEDPDESYHEALGKDAPTQVDEDALKIVLGSIQTDAKAAGVPDDRMAALASQAGVKGRISACRDIAALQKLSDLVRLENG